MRQNKPITPSKNLLDPRFDRDACGMGFIAQIDGTASHQLLQDALEMLKNMNHRGGTGAEIETGDGAGILTTIPHRFFVKQCAEQAVILPEAGDYALAVLFLNPYHEAALLKNIKRLCAEQGFSVLLRRPVDTDLEHCGPAAVAMMPKIDQLILARPAHIARGRAFEDELFKLRRMIETSCDQDEVSVVSLSAQTLIYKGMLHARQLRDFYPDLQHVDFMVSSALIHARFSTNTFPSWNRAQPFRFLAHNGEINTLQAATNWMKSNHLAIYDETTSDSAMLENCMEYFYRHGRSVPQALMMMIPEAHGPAAQLPEDLTYFYKYTSSFMVPWDGPAALCFSDGTQIGARLDRNGLRPARYVRTHDGRFVLASEAGALDLNPAVIAEVGQLGPGEMIMVDTARHHVYKNQELKAQIAGLQPWKAWVEDTMIPIESLVHTNVSDELTAAEIEILQHRNGYTHEVLDNILIPMAEQGEEPTAAMGYDAPLSILSALPKSFFTYFKQQFAQVTNPPIDAAREPLMIDTAMYLGADQDMTRDYPANCAKIRIPEPVLSTAQFLALRDHTPSAQKAVCLEMSYDQCYNLKQALDQLFAQAVAAIQNGATLLILSDRQAVHPRAVIPVLLAVSGLHHHLIHEGVRAQISLVVESAELYEVHQYAMLISYGASALYPYLAYQSLKGYDLSRYQAACNKGIVKIMSRMGISILNGYHGAQLFEAIGVSNALIEPYMSGTISRIGGLDLKGLEAEYKRFYDLAFTTEDSPMPRGGDYRYDKNGEHHTFNPTTIRLFQKAVRENDVDLYRDYLQNLHQEDEQHPTTLRSLWTFKSDRPAIALDQVESAEAIFVHFKAAAMSYGALSQEAHETIAAAMNGLGSSSNCGEGGEDRNRYMTATNSKIKQISSGRFGVNAAYLMSAEEIQIKMAQGAKPGEGGQLPGSKVFPWIAEIRESTPGVTLISPPPHHDIYSIEDLAQLIYDLKSVNPKAHISVKLASTAGVGTVAAGAVKAGADLVVISGFDGGTGASPRNSIRDAGIPWEIGLAEAHQTLSANHLRGRVSLEVDGKLMSGRDVAIAALLGAETFNFGTLILIGLGCVMARVCHKNTCPIGIASQDPKLRAKFAGTAEHIRHGMKFIALELREIMADLGFSTLTEMIGHSDLLVTKPQKLLKGNLDFSAILNHSLPLQGKIVNPARRNAVQVMTEDELSLARNANEPLFYEGEIHNTDRSVGAWLGGWLATHPVAEPLFYQQYTGTAGQSFGRFGSSGAQLTLIGRANDYVAKGLSGGRIIIKAPDTAGYSTAGSPIVGNVACFGATGGEVYLNGMAGERFCVRNSGAKVVVEGIGDHGCEYMTGGICVVLGTTGRNFAAGMSGGLAYVYDLEGNFAQRCNPSMVDLYGLSDVDEQQLHTLISNHQRYTNSALAKQLIADWLLEKDKFIKVYPKEFHKVMDIQEQLSEQGYRGVQLAAEAFARSQQ